MFFSIRKIAIFSGLFLLAQHALSDAGEHYFYLSINECSGDGYIEIISEEKKVSYMPESFEMLQFEPIIGSAKVCFHGQGNLVILQKAAESNAENSFELQDNTPDKKCKILQEVWDSPTNRAIRTAVVFANRVTVDENHSTQAITRGNKKFPVSCSEGEDNSCVTDSKAVAQYIQPGVYEVLIVPLAFFVADHQAYEGYQLQLLSTQSAQDSAIAKSENNPDDMSILSTTVISQGSAIFSHILIEDGRHYRLCTNTGKTVLDMLPMDIETLRKNKLWSKGVLPFSGHSQNHTDEIRYYEQSLQSNRSFLYLNALNKLYQYGYDE